MLYWIKVVACGATYVMAVNLSPVVVWIGKIRALVRKHVLAHQIRIYSIGSHVSMSSSDIGFYS